jgi:hypothetical protein
VRAAIALGGVAAGLAGGCHARAVDPPPIALAHDAYVWQRAWTEPVRAAVAAAPGELTGLRVLTLEVEDARDAWPDVDAAALAATGRPVIAVVRIDGSRPIAGLSLAPVVDRIAAWRRTGVDVTGVEIDHDCATAALADYAAWLARARPGADARTAPLAWSITALPSWADAPADLARVAAAVDEIVVQVHAVRAPALFDSVDARRWLARFAAVVPGRPLRVALPDYRVTVAGTPLAADPTDVAGFVRDLERHPIAGLRGVSWFRLPVDADPTTWRTATLRAVITGAPLVARVGVELIPRDHSAFDVVVANAGTVDAPYPAIDVAGARAFDLVRRDAILPAGARVIAGWATGSEVTAHVH